METRLQKSYAEALKSMQTKVALPMFTVSQDTGLTATHNITLSGEIHRQLAKMGAVRDHEYAFPGGVIRAKDMVMGKILVKYDSEETARKFAKGFAFHWNADITEVYAPGIQQAVEEGKVVRKKVLMNSKGEVAKLTKTQKSQMLIAKPVGHSAGSIKDLGLHVMDMVEMGGEEGYKNFMGKLTHGAYGYYEEKFSKGVEPVEIANTTVRFSAGDASSTPLQGVVETRKLKEVFSANHIDVSDMHPIATYDINELSGKIKELKDVNPDAVLDLVEFFESTAVELTVYLGKIDATDGEQLMSAEKHSQLVNLALGWNTPAEHFVGFKYQTRPLGTAVKDAALVTRKEFVKKQVEYVLHLNNSHHHVLDFNSIRGNEELKHSFMLCLDKQFDKQSMFSKGDVVTVKFGNEVQYDTFLTLNEIKTVFDITTAKYKDNVMSYAKHKEVEVKVSNQFLFTPLTAEDPTEGLKHAVKEGKKEVRKAFDRIGEGKPKVVDLKLLAEDKEVHAPTLARIAQPELAMKNRKLFLGEVQSAVNSTSNMVNKQYITGQKGSYDVIVPDMATRFGEVILNDKEIYWTNWARVKKSVIQELKTLQKDTEKAYEKAKAANDQKALDALKLSFAELKEAQRLLKEDIVLMYRNPKNSPHQIAAYKVIGINEIEKRSTKIVAKGGFYDNEIHDLVVEQFKKSAVGTVIVPGSSDSASLHSGWDFDIDAVTILWSLGFYKTTKNVMPYFAEVTFE